MPTPKANVASGPYSGIPKITALLAESGLSAAELARRIDVFPSTVSAWQSGKHETPGAVVAYLSLLAKVRALGL